jgi:import inner membrane translocase subunit TIM44
MAKNKEMKENLKKFREEAQKLENTDALKKAREKFQAVESEASKGSDVLKEKVNVLKEKVQEALSDAQKTEFVKKAGQITEGIGKTAKGASDTIVETGQKISKTAPFKTISETADAVRKEIDLSGARIYR